MSDLTRGARLEDFLFLIPRGHGISATNPCQILVGVVLTVMTGFHLIAGGISLCDGHSEHAVTDLQRLTADFLANVIHLVKVIKVFLQVLQGRGIPVTTDNGVFEVLVRRRVGEDLRCGIRVMALEEPEGGLRLLRGQLRIRVRSLLLRGGRTVERRLRRSHVLLRLLDVRLLLREIRGRGLHGLGGLVRLRLRGRDSLVVRGLVGLRLVQRLVRLLLGFDLDLQGRLGQGHRVLRALRGGLLVGQVLFGLALRRRGLLGGLAGRLDRLGRILRGLFGGRDLRRVGSVRSGLLDRIEILFGGLQRILRLGVLALGVRPGRIGRVGRLLGGLHVIVELRRVVAGCGLGRLIGGPLRRILVLLCALHGRLSGRVSRLRLIRGRLCGRLRILRGLHIILRGLLLVLGVLHVLLGGLCRRIGRNRGLDLRLGLLGGLVGLRGLSLLGLDIRLRGRLRVLRRLDVRLRGLDRVDRGHGSLLRGLVRGFGRGRLVGHRGLRGKHRRSGQTDRQHRLHIERCALRRRCRVMCYILLHGSSFPLRSPAGPFPGADTPRSCVPDRIPSLILHALPYSHGGINVRRRGKATPHRPPCRPTKRRPEPATPVPTA